jgi:hypothetical protein
MGRRNPGGLLLVDVHRIDMEPQYQPGVCNIGPTQQRRRLLLGVGSLLLAVLYVAAVIAVGWPRWALLVATFPLYGVAMGYIQYRERFCVGFAGMGIFDIGDGTNQVLDEAALAADRKRAVQLNAKSLAVGVAGALLIYGVALIAF